MALTEVREFITHSDRVGYKVKKNALSLGKRPTMNSYNTFLEHLV